VDDPFSCPDGWSAALFLYGNSGWPADFRLEIKALFPSRAFARTEALGCAGIFTFWRRFASQPASAGSGLPAGHYLLADADTLEFGPGGPLSFPVADQDACNRHGPSTRSWNNFSTAHSGLPDSLRADVRSARTSVAAGFLDYCRGYRRYASNRWNLLDCVSDEPFDEALPAGKGRPFGLTSCRSSHDATLEKSSGGGLACPSALMRTSPAPFFVSKLVRENRLQIVLTGEEADEFLGVRYF